MNDTKIEWCDMTWNPVTGCLHGCEYCYAKKVAHRFDGKVFDTSPLPGGLHQDDVGDGAGREIADQIPVVDPPVHPADQDRVSIL